jgi:hypothetical protein
MRCSLLEKIRLDLVETDPYFQQKKEVSMSDLTQCFSCRFGSN